MTGPNDCKNSSAGFERTRMYQEIGCCGSELSHRASDTKTIPTRCVWAVATLSFGAERFQVKHEASGVDLFGFCL